MHFLNGILSDAEKLSIPIDEQKSFEEIQATLVDVDGVLNSGDIVDNKLIGKLIRLVNTHQTLKYALEPRFRGLVASQFLRIYETNKVSVNMKVRLLSILKSVCKKGSAFMPNFSYSWRLIWGDILAVVSRDGRHEATCTEHVVVQYINALVSFLHNSRAYIAHDLNTPSGLGDIVDTAMASLEDTRLPICLEGLLLLLNCLPTDYPKYDQVLPLWLAKWSSIQNNNHWDACWATLFCRSRKYSTAFDWVSVGPFLMSRAKQLMQLPTTESGNQGNNHSEFPSTFPAYYIKLIDVATDQKNVGLMKISKLLYFLTIFNPAQAAQELITMTPPVDTTEVSSKGTVLLAGFNTTTKATVSKSAVDMVAFLQSLRTYVYPSNSGSWTQQLAYFVASFVFQLCRHVGRAVADTVLGGEVAAEGERLPWLLYRRPLHLATLRYLCGSVLSIVMEGLYGKNQVMTQLFSSCLKNLVTIDASIGNVFVPFLLSALDPAAVNQSHQAPIAMQTLTLCFKTLMYPSPVILKYLPDIMRLSLPGIDASDTAKTTLALFLYSNILSWIPITASYKAPPASAYLPSYLSLVSTSDEKVVDSTRISSDEYQSQWDALSEYLHEWAPAMLDKIFMLLDAQEEKVKGVRDSPVISAVGQCSGYLFQAIPVNEPLRAVVEDKLMAYFLTCTAKNAAKACAKVMESMVSTNPAKLSSVLAAVLTPDILSGDTTHDKLSFRLYLASGACRAALGVNIVSSLPILEPVITSATLINHSEKPVRKAVGKLIRDVLKGAASFYPVTITPLFESNNIIGAPSETEGGQIKWHAPDAASVSHMVKVLRMTLDKFLGEIQAALASTATVPASAAALKKVEDQISNHLHIIERIIRGSAEILGDDEFEGLAQHEGHFLSTGRAAVWAQLSAGDAQYLRTSRSRLLQFLSNLHETLTALPADSGYSSLRNNAVIVPQWMKVLNLVVTRRTASMKDVDNTKKWLTYTKRTSRTSIAKMVYKICKGRELNPPRGGVTFGASSGSLSAEWRQRVASKEFWQGHDLNTNTVACSAWLQHGIRAHELSYNAIRVTVPGSNNAHTPTMRCMAQLVTLGEHEYDAIRQKAHKQFEKMTGRFGYRLNGIVVGLLSTLSRPETTYTQAMGSLQLLKQSRIIKRIMGDWELTEQFLAAVSAAQGVISGLAEVDKREKVMLALTEVFIKYVSGWSHAVLRDSQSTAAVIRAALSNVGYTAAASVQDDAMSVVSDESTTTAASGLRFETFAAYIMLHFIGHRSVEITPLVWQWALSALCKAHGQPTQNIALSALARLAQIGATQPDFAQSATGAAAKSLLSVYEENAKDQWNAILQGVAQTRAKTAEDGSSAQWSKGIDQILRSSEFLKIVLTRDVTCSLSERNLYSNHFSRENAGVFFSLASAGLLNGADSSVFTASALTSLFLFAADLPSTNEGEIRSNNATRSELFGGLLRAYNTSVPAGQSAEVQQAFLSYLLESTEKLSVDYMKDWGEALFFGLSGHRSGVDDAIPRHIADAFRQLVRSQTSTAASDASEEGKTLSLQGKLLILVKALLQADLSRSRAASPVGEVFAGIVNDPSGSVVSPFRTSRIEIASILAMLTELSVVRPDMSALRASLVTACAISKDGSASEAMSVVSGDQTPPEEDAADKSLPTGVKNARETACIWLQFLVQRVPVWKFEEELVELLNVSLAGISSGDLETIKMGVDTAVFVSKALHDRGTSAAGTSEGHVKRVIALFDSLVSGHSSWKVRETTLKCLVIVMVNNWFSLDADLRKQCKDVFAKGIADAKLEVQHLSKAGMVAYLAYKTSNELQSIAAAYIKNSDIFAEREKKRRRVQKDASSTSYAAEKPDPVYQTTIIMMGCLVLASPYDMPAYLPALVSSLLRHTTNTVLKDSITRAIQVFKMSHQDRWEEFKLKFTREQLEDLQGAGAAHYFS